MALGRRPEVDVYISPFILGEVEDVLFSDKFNWARSRLEGAVRELSQWTTIVEPTTVVRGISRDPADNPILECCLEANADYLVTGDHDLLSLESFRGTEIVNGATFLRIFGGAGSSSNLPA